VALSETNSETSETPHISAYAPQLRKSERKKHHYINDVGDPFQIATEPPKPAKPKLVSLGVEAGAFSSAANHDYVRGLGGDEIIDYNATDFTQVVTGCGAVFDTVGGDVAQRSFAVLKPGGRAAFIASGAQAPKPHRNDVTPQASGWTCSAAS
jgi:hypothetical protein